MSSVHPWVSSPLPVTTTCSSPFHSHPTIPHSGGVPVLPYYLCRLVYCYHHFPNTTMPSLGSSPSHLATPYAAHIPARLYCLPAPLHGSSTVRVLDFWTPHTTCMCFGYLYLLWFICAFFCLHVGSRFGLQFYLLLPSHTPVPLHGSAVIRFSAHHHHVPHHHHRHCLTTTTLYLTPVLLLPPPRLPPVILHIPFVGSLVHLPATPPLPFLPEFSFFATLVTAALYYHLQHAHLYILPAVGFAIPPPRYRAPFTTHTATPPHHTYHLLLLVLVRCLRLLRVRITTLLPRTHTVGSFPFGSATCPARCARFWLDLTYLPTVLYFTGYLVPRACPFYHTVWIYLLYGSFAITITLYIFLPYLCRSCRVHPFPPRHTVYTLPFGWFVPFAVTFALPVWLHLRLFNTRTVHISLPRFTAYPTPPTYHFTHTHTFPYLTVTGSLGWLLLLFVVG